MDIEMQTVRTNGDHGGTYSSNEPVSAANGDSGAKTIIEAKETDVLLSVPSESCNGEKISCIHEAEAQANVGNTEAAGCNGDKLLSGSSAESQSSCGNSPPKNRSLKKELNATLYGKFKLWMALVLLFLLIIAVIIISLLLCSAIHVDKDEKYDPSLFKFPLFFNGSFQLPNMVFTEELITQSFKENQTLAAGLQGKLDDLYRSSPALGRYFSGVEIYAFRNGSVIADYVLKFLMPEEQQDQLRNFVLSREMVYNVFRQFLYDQESDSGPMYIDPVSLVMILKQ